MSPLGATRITRGMTSLSAKRPTWKPGGACGMAPAGRSTIFERVDADSVAKGWGRSATVILRKMPGFTVNDETNADGPVRTLAGLASPRTSRTVPAAAAKMETITSARRMDFMVLPSRK